jgi:hypothetical protein
MFHHLFLRHLQMSKIPESLFLEESSFTKYLLSDRCNQFRLNKRQQEYQFH